MRSVSKLTFISAQAHSTTTGWKPRGLEVVDEKSTVVGDLLALLLFDVLQNHLVRDGA